MSYRLTNLPREIQIHVFSYLRHEDLVKVIRTCKFLHGLIEPLIWTHVELHDSNWHSSDRYQDMLVHPDKQAREYIEPSPELFQYYGLHNPTRFMRQDFLAGRCKHFFGSIGSVPAKRPHHQLVKTICMTINFTSGDKKLPDNMWSLFSCFANLEALELIVEWSYPSSDEWDLPNQHFCKADPPPLTKLKKCRLRGYVPQAFARWILMNSENLTTLELAILDRPIGSSLSYTRVNPPLSRKGDDEPLDDQDDEDDDDDDDGPIQWATEDSDTSSDSGTDYSHKETIAPRALCILKPNDHLDHFKNLSNLILIRPAESNKDALISSFQEIFCSISSDEAILHEWTRLIRATRPTVKHLVLEQRPFCESIELDGTGSVEFLEMYPYGPGFARFQEIVLPILLEDAEWPMLETITFYGFDVPEPLQTQPHPRVQRPWPSQGFKNSNSFLPAVRERFQPSGVRVGFALGTRMEFEEETGVVMGDDGLGARLPDSEDEDEVVPPEPVF